MTHAGMKPTCCVSAPPGASGEDKGVLFALAAGPWLFPRRRPVLDKLVRSVLCVHAVSIHTRPFLRIGLRHAQQRAIEVLTQTRQLLERPETHSTRSGSSSSYKSFYYITPDYGRRHINLSYTTLQSSASMKRLHPK